MTISVDPVPSDLSASTESLTFTPENWNQPQAVTIQSADNENTPVSAEFTFTPDSAAISAVSQTFAEAPPPSFSCHDDFSGNATGWPTGSAWAGNMVVTTGSVAVPLIYSNAAVYAHGGSHAVKITADVTGNSSSAYRRSIPTQTNTFYISFLARYNSAALSTWDYIGCGQKVANGDTGAALGHVDASSVCGAAYIKDGNTKAPLGSANPQANRTYMLVAKYTWDASSSKFTSLTAYLNPLSASNELAEASATVAGSVIAPFSSVDFQYYGKVDAAFDEIRVGRTWGDVVPANTPPPEVSQPLSITLIYDEADQSTPQWGIVANTATNWYTSAESIALDPGAYHIVYSSSFQSKKPADEEITIIAGQSRSLTRQYRQAEPVTWPESSVAVIDISTLGDSQSATNGNGLLAQHFGVYPALQTVAAARLNGSISISDSADLIGSLDRASRPQDQTWVYDWSSLKPTLHTNTVDWGECDWIGLHTPSVGFDLAGAYAPGGDVHPYNSKVDHTTTDGTASSNDYYPSGGEFYDLEAAYFDNDKDHFYISFVCSAPFSNEWVNAAGTLCRDLGIPATASTRTNALVIPGDIAFDFGLNTAGGATFSYDFGIDLTHEVRDQSQWFLINHIYSNSASSTASFSYKRPPVRDLNAGSALYRTANTDWFLGLDSSAAIAAGGEHSNFDPADAASTANYKGEVQSHVYRLEFPDGRLENDLPTYVYEFVVPRSLFGGAETNRSYIKVRFLPTTCRNDGNSRDHVFYLNNVTLDEPASTGYGAIGNRAWFDANGNGIQDDNENNLGVTNVQVVAVSQSTGMAFTNHTDALGFYLFDKVPAGYYDIYFEYPDVYRLTRYNPNFPESAPPTTGIPERGHNVDATTTGIKDVRVVAGVTNLNADIGLYYAPTLSVITSFRAYERDGKVFVAWETAAEYDTKFYWIERFVGEDWIRINAGKPVWAQLTGGPASYELADSGARPGSTETWRVIEVEGSGSENIYGPYTVTVDGAAADFDAWADAIDWNGKASGRDDDPDGDGLTNFEEFLAGTNPLDANSVLKITSLKPVANGIEIRWSTVKGTVYAVEYTTKLDGAWLPVKTGIVAQSEETSFVLPAADRGFFRIVVNGE